MSDDNSLLSWAFIGLPVSMGLFFYGWKWLKQKRFIEEIPTSKVRSIALGLVEIQGKIVAAATIPSPILKKNCVFYYTKVEELRSSGKSSRWVTIKEFKLSLPFYLEDETGKVLVHPQGSDVDIKRDFEYQAKTFNNSYEQSVRQFCQEFNIELTSFLGLTRPLRFRECFLEPGDLVYILGKAIDNPEVKHFINNQDNILISKPEDSMRFLISDYSEKELLDKFFWKSILGIIGGPIIFLASLGYILFYFGKF